MWKSLQKTRGISQDLNVSFKEIFESSFRSIFGSILGLYLAWHFFATIHRPERFSARTWLFSAGVGLCAYLILRLLPRSLFLASLALQASLVALSLLASVVYGAPEVILALALVPLIAVTTVEWKWALGSLALVWAALLAVGQGILPLPVGEGLLLAAGAAAGVAYVVGLASGSSMMVATEWSALGFRRAREMTEEARRNQAHLAVVLRNLDQAYYRLERVNTELVVTKKKAEEIESFKTRLTAMVSHELRTPLNLIIGFSEVMMTSPESYEGQALPPVYRSDINAIYQSARHVLSLVDDILDITRAEAGKITLNRQEEDLREVVDEAAGMVQEYISAKSLDFQVELPAASIPVNLDRLRIRQVILNLLVNAIRFTKKGMIRVQVIDMPDEVRVEVKDTGRGIPSADQPMVFSDFQSTETQSLNWHGSSGLGLSISKKFVELHSGRIGFESLVETGSTFWFTLPKEAAAAAQPPAYTIREILPEQKIVYKERILVAAPEDLEILPYLRRHLDGFQILTAPGGAEGLRLAHDVRAMAVLSDSPLPEEPPEGVVGVCLPSGGSRLVREEHHVAATLVKPVTRQALLEAVARVEQAQPAGRAPRRILAADDDPDVARMYARMLAPPQGPGEPGMEFLPAYNGAEALAVMREQAPDLVFLDIAMPEMDGWEVLRQKSADPAIAQIPVIIISARVEETLSARLQGSLCFTQPGGFNMGEVAQMVEAGLAVLEPGWFKL